jgi:hypothetical protein
MMPLSREAKQEKKSKVMAFILIELFLGTVEENMIPITLLF